ncbi:ATP-binding cassette domain-containing protein [Prosthecobacter fluviatilis]|uniref:ATP-binding cassette domain-containing protein n=1 Tax=Prosthecobacter fluviatilis TaxID=445931 RepID=A0ABW0KNG3_9BACT
MIQLENISWSIPGRTILREVNADIPSGAYAVLMGATGCGKTSLLEIICGLRAPASGRVLLDGVDVTRLEPRERGIGYVPQDLALFPGLCVREQIGFAPKLRGLPPVEISQRVCRLAEQFGITPLLDRQPDMLSGGEKQRVALARALAAQPRLLLLDEPLSALDEGMRAEAASLLQHVQQQHSLTVLHVTHSRSEAAALGSLHLRMVAGRLEVE